MIKINNINEEDLSIDLNNISFSTVQENKSEIYTGKVYDLEVENEPVYETNIGFCHNGGGKRRGSACVYLESFHLDIFDFLDLRKNNGKEELRARDLNLALWCPNHFFRAVKNNEEYHLMDPNVSKGLSDVYDESFDGGSFTDLYNKYVSEGKFVKKVPARDLWLAIITSQIETGQPYVLAKDQANFKSNQKSLGAIKSSNLCVSFDTKIVIRKSMNDKDENITIENATKRFQNGEELYVKSYDTNKKEIVYNKILNAAMTNNNAKVVKLIYGNEELICTPDHKIFTEDRGYVEAKNLLPTDTLLTSRNDGNFGLEMMWNNISVEQVKKSHPNLKPYHTSVYDLTVDNTNNFFANDILVHNCAEIIEYSDANETAVCNLASISLTSCIEGKKYKRFFNFDKLAEITETLTKNLNQVIDIEYYPVEKARRSNMRHRPIGIGVQGLSDVFCLMRYQWGSEESRQLNKDIFETIYYAAMKTSCELAKRDGYYETFPGSPTSKGLFQFDLWNIKPSNRYDWVKLKEDVMKYGIRNSLLLANMPTGSTSQLLGNTEMVEIISSNIYKRQTLSGEFFVINKYLIEDLIELKIWNDDIRNKIMLANGSIQDIPEIPDNIKSLYKTVWETPQKIIIDMAADRGAYICQSQSMNLYFKDANVAKISSALMYAWEKGLKTLVYYTRSTAAREAIKFTVPITENKNAEDLVCSLDNPEACEACGS